MRHPRLFYPFKVKGHFPAYHPGPVFSHWKEAAETKGYVVLGRGGGGHQTLVLGCRKCGEPLFRRTIVVQNNNIHCRSCLRQPYDEAAERFGAKIITGDQAGGRHDRTLKLSCGHTKKLQRNQVKKVGRGEVNVDCRTCRHKRYDDAARLNGWRFLKPSGDRVGYGVYRHKCGIEHQVSIGNMMTGRCACPQCGPEKGPVGSGIYIFQIDLPGLPVVKLGHSHRFEDRLHRDLKIDKDVPTEVLRYHPMPSRYLARTQEEAAHEILKARYPDWVVPKSVFGNAITVKSEIYRPQVLPAIHQLLDEIAARHPAPV